MGEVSAAKRLKLMEKVSAAKCLKLMEKVSVLPGTSAAPINAALSEFNADDRWKEMRRVLCAFRNWLIKRFVIVRARAHA